jgi:hypothetical protein
MADGKLKDAGDIIEDSKTSISINPSLSYFISINTPTKLNYKGCYSIETGESTTNE